MNLESINKIKGVLDILLENESRINEAKPVRYWYPLSLATYGADEIIEALDSMCSFRTSMAEKTLQFERQFSKYQESADAVMVNSGSSADLLLSLLLTDPRQPRVEAGDEVIVPVVTWPTQIWSVLMAGLRVRLVDVDPCTLNIDFDEIEAAITPRTRALFIVHLMGNPCDMERVRQICTKYNLLLLEDCCEAMGASWDGRKVGNFGLGGAFSFFFSHHITTMEGGMLSVPDAAIAEQLRLLRAHGWVRNVDPQHYSLSKYPDIDPRYAFVNWGLNVRPTEVQAGFGLRQLEKADAFARTRECFAGVFREFLATTNGLLTAPLVHPKAKPSWLALPVMVSADSPFTREELTSYLETNGIETRPIVTGNVARHPVASLFPDLQGRVFLGADKVHEYGFYIGLSPLQTTQNIDRLLGVFQSFLGKYLK